MSGLTFEAVALETAKALEPLADRLGDGEVELLFSELGLPAPDVVLAAPGVVTAISGTVTKLTELPPKVVALANAIDAENVTQIVDAVKAMVPTVQGVIATIDNLANAVDAAAAGAASGEIRAFAAEMPDRLVGYLLATYLDREHAVIHGVASLLGIIETTPVAATAAAPAHTRRRIRFDLLDDLLDDPLESVTTTYRWGQPNFDYDLLFERLLRFGNQVSTFAFMQPGASGGPPVLRIGMVDIGRTPDPVPGLRAALRVDLPEKLDVTVPIRPGLALEIGLRSTLEAGAAIDVIPPGELRIDPPTSEVSGVARVGLVASNPDGGNMSLLSMGGTSGLFAARLRASVGGDVAWNLSDGAATGHLLVEVAVEKGQVVIDLAGADGFLSTILPEGGITVPFDVLAGWSSERGVYLEGGAGVAIDIPVDLELGPVKIQMLHLELSIGSAGLELEASGAVSAMLGPFAMAVERMGTTARLSFPSPGGGNLGPAHLAFAFKAPSGIGLALDAGVVKGGGFLSIDEARGEYAGVLELSFGPVSIKAIGILTTKLPGGRDGWALLLLVFGEFTPVQLGFGFTLNGVGGIIGLQHGVSIEALQSGLRTGVLDSVLFPRDPVANAPALLAQLRVVFPIVPRALTVGPALKLGWSTPALVTVTLGIILQFDDVLGSGPGTPSFSRVVLVGQLKVQIPPVDELGLDAPALIHLQVDLVGAYDANEQALSIDAVLRDSHVAMIPVVGSLVVRARFGSDPTFILAVGGFHPRFTDLPPGIPPQERVGIQLRYGIVTVRIVGYVAITSNSFQIGAEASLVAAGGGFRVEAFLGFDALFTFDPFHFEIDFRVGAAVKYKSISLASLTVKGIVSGPGRWEVEGHASISLLFFSVGIDFEVAWGSAPNPTPPSVEVGKKISQALSAPESWHAELPSGDPLVTLRTVDASDDVVAHPLGSLVGVQKVVPLGLDIDRVGRSVPSDGRRFDITAVSIGGVPVEDPTFRDEHFARAEYVDVSEEDKLSKPSFERFKAGVAVSTDDFGVPASQVVFEPEWETAYLPQRKPRDLHLVPASSLVLHAQLGAVARSAINATRRLAGDVTKVTVAPVGFGVAAERRPGETVAGGALTFTAAEQLSAATTGTTFVVDVAELAVLP